MKLLTQIQGLESGPKLQVSAEPVTSTVDPPMITIKSSSILHRVGWTCPGRGNNNIPSVTASGIYGRVECTDIEKLLLIDLTTAGGKNRVSRAVTILASADQGSTITIQPAQPYKVEHVFSHRYSHASTLVSEHF